MPWYHDDDYKTPDCDICGRNICTYEEPAFNERLLEGNTVGWDKKKDHCILAEKAYCAWCFSKLVREIVMAADDMSLEVLCERFKAEQGLVDKPDWTCLTEDMAPCISCHRLQTYRQAREKYDPTPL